MRDRLLASSVVLLLLAAGGCGSAPASSPRTAATAPSSVAGQPVNKGPLLSDPLEGSAVTLTTPTPAPIAAIASHLGVRIQAPGLGIDLPIVEGDGREPPLYVAAHYPGMKWPGEGDRTFLYAHARPGMFGGLFTPAVGQKVNILEPNGGVFHYTIRSYTQSWPVTDMSIVQPVGHEELVLYTCTSWNYSDPKIVAIAEPDQG